MPNIRIFTPNRYAVIYASNETVIFADIQANQGTDISGIITRTAKNSEIVRAVLETAGEQGLVVRRNDLAGVEKVFMADYWTNLIINNKANARSWVADPVNNCNTSGGTASAMAVSLSIPEALAIELADMMNREGTAKIRWF